MTTSVKYKYIYIVIFLIAAGVRFASLEIRPMHTDEAVHGIKFGALLEEGIYNYDKEDYHGPTLNYLTLIPALIRGQNNLTSLDEFTLRSIPAFTGLALLLLILLLPKSFSWPEKLGLTVLLAVAPMLAFYSRYYIQEVLFVFFNVGLVITAYRYLLCKKTGWLIIAALFAGLMMATKETWVLFLGIQVLALLLVLWHKTNLYRAKMELLAFLKTRQFFIFLFLIVIVYLLFYSSFFTNPEGIIESVRAFTGYLDRAGSEVHSHPWWYYFEIIIKSTERLIRADGWFLAAGIAGIVLLVTKKERNAHHNFYLFWGYTTVFSTILLSLLSYKTPWNILIPYTGMIFLTQHTINHLIIRRYEILKYLIFFAVIFHLSYQTFRDNFIHYADPQNTLVYSHPTDDIFDINQRVHEIYQAIPGEMSLFTQVIYPGHDYWPLPWYFRNLSNIGWQSQIQMQETAAPLIITHLPNPRLSQKLYEEPPPGQRYLYIPVFKQDKLLRPGATVNLLLRKDYWEVYQKKQVE